MKKSKLEKEIQAEESNVNFYKIFCKTFPKVYEKGLERIAEDFQDDSKKYSRNKWPKNTSNLRLDLKRIVMNMWNKKTHLFLVELHKDRIKSQERLRKLRKKLSK